MRMFLLAAAAATVIATPAFAVTNLIRNGSFEAAGTTGTGAFTHWTKTNIPDLSPPQDQPASVILYNSNAAYPVGAYGEAVGPDNIAASASPDAVGNYAAYFVGDFSVNETLGQMTYLTPGNYRVGFSYYLTNNGLANPNNASLDVTILGIPVASTMITDASQGGTWFYASGVGQILNPGFYPTALVFNSNGFPSKDVVVDRVFAIATTDAADVVIPALPEPSTWAMLVAGFGFVGFGLRRRRRMVVAA
ncbi:PEPxxWA-CTERM sorting domain-containing protein [Sandarakinorhabdus sp.]|uniref:PEPxxWA-CTERM sorting domain-containing protein n=1 Tax=Sandarakinorhabdus sp. TaxID=1916663 RepID=UPI003F72E232